MCPLSIAECNAALDARNAKLNTGTVEIRTGAAADKHDKEGHVPSPVQRAGLFHPMGERGVDPVYHGNDKDRTYEKLQKGPVEHIYS